MRRVGLALAALVAVGCAPDAPPPGGADAGATGGSAVGLAVDLDGRTSVVTPLRIDTDRAPAAIGPYSQGVLAGNTLYLAGQIALDPATGEMVGAGGAGGTGNIAAETRQVLENLGAVLDAAGFSFDQVVQSQVFLVDLADFGAMNEVYAGYFGDVPPARATVGVATLPRGARVEIIMTAVR